MARLTASLLVALVCGICAAAAPASISESTVRAHMEFLASDALNGRGSGTRDEWLAATYIASQLQRAGVEPLDGTYVQTIERQEIEVQGMPVLEVGSLRLTHGKEMIVIALGKNAVTGNLQKFRAGKRVRPGAALLLAEKGAPPSPESVATAAIVLRVETSDARAHWDELGTRTLALGKKPNAPLRVILSAEAYKQVQALPEGVVVSFTASTAQRTAKTWNAVGRLTGTDAARRSEVVLLTAHLDHLGAANENKADAPMSDRIFNGADDDASGSTAVLALAEALAQSPRARRTFVFAWFGSEEVGGFGGEYFVDKPAVALNRIVANLEFEMIGRPDPAVAADMLWLTGWERTTLGPELAKQGARVVADPHPEQDFFNRSDNITLARRGVVAQTLSSFGLHSEYHQPSDDIAHIDFNHMTRAIQSMLGPLRWLADSDFTPQWKKGGRPVP